MPIVWVCPIILVIPFHACSEVYKVLVRIVVYHTLQVYLMMCGGTDSSCSTGWQPLPTSASPPMPLYQVCLTCLYNYYWGRAGTESLELYLQCDMTAALVVLNFFLQELFAGQSTLPLHCIKHYDTEV